MKKSPSNGSVLLSTFGSWEVRLTPLNKLFIVNTRTDTTHWPFLDKRSAVRFSVVNGSSYPPEDVQQAAEKVLKKQRLIRSQHHEDFVETTDQYTFN